MNEASKRILEELKHSYECLFVKTGIEPNYFLLSSDILPIVTARGNIV